jgi:hypothetical protein
MSTTTSNAPEHFHVVHLDLAREAGHPTGSARDRYTLLLPLDGEGRILEAEARRHPDHCRVSHTDEHDEIVRGLLRPAPEGAWSFDFSAAGQGEETGFRFAQERFTPGEYVSIVRDGEEHTYRVISLQPL